MSSGGDEGVPLPLGAASRPTFVEEKVLPEKHFQTEYAEQAKCTAQSHTRHDTALWRGSSERSLLTVDSTWLYARCVRTHYSTLPFL